MAYIIWTLISMIHHLWRKWWNKLNSCLYNKGMMIKIRKKNCKQAFFVSLQLAFFWMGVFFYHNIIEFIFIKSLYRATKRLRVEYFKVRNFHGVTVLLTFLRKFIPSKSFKMCRPRKFFSRKIKKELNSFTSVLKWWNLSILFLFTNQII